MDDQVISAIDNSSLTLEDKNHWKELLPKMNNNQKSRFLDIIITKTQVKSAINSIKRALEIIDEAEAEAEEEDKSADTSTQENLKKESVDLLDKLEQNPHIKKPTPDTQVALQKQKQISEAKLVKLRTELKQISQTLQGSAPPSYN